MLQEGLSRSLILAQIALNLLQNTMVRYPNGHDIRRLNYQKPLKFF
jgi:hypothetical protein